MSTTPRADRHPPTGAVARDPPASRLRTLPTPADNFSLNPSINPPTLAAPAAPTAPTAPTAATAPTAPTASSAPVRDAVDNRTTNGSVQDAVLPVQHAVVTVADATATPAADSDVVAPAAYADSVADADAGAVGGAVDAATASRDTTTGCRPDWSCGAPAACAGSAASSSPTCRCSAEPRAMSRRAEADEAPLLDQGREADGRSARGSSPSPAGPAVVPQPPPLEDDEEDEIVPVARDAADATPEEVSSEAAVAAAADAAEARRLADEQRKAFMLVNSDPTLSVMEKTSRMQAMHLKRSHETQTRLLAEAAKRNRSNTITYHNCDENIWGCKHYPRKCSVKPVCCGEWYTCRLCHDDESDHQCDRKLIEEVKCMSCDTVQPVAAECRSCKTRFAGYFCEICRLYDDTPGKPLYHCEKCGICRVGKNNYHCEKCNACVAAGRNKGEHRCVNNALDVCCPCCQRYLYDSTDKVVFIMCGHAMHASCLEVYAANSFTCPLCHKELGDMARLYETYEAERAAQVMPESYANHKVHIKCYQCSTESHVSFHFTHHNRCDRCNSFNTYVIKQYILEAADGAPAGPSTAAGVTAPPAIGGVVVGGVVAGVGGGDVEQP